MDAYVQCPECRAICRAGSGACLLCGASLEGAAPVAAPAPRPSGEGDGHTAILSPSRSDEFQRDLDSTRKGIALLATGSLISWIPLIGFIGALISLIGAIMAIMGWRVFGRNHGRNVGIATVLYVVAFVGSLVLAEAFLSSISDAMLLPAGQAQASITSAFNMLLVGAVALSLASGPATVFFLWELLNPTGRVLVLTAYLAGVLVGCLIYIAIMPQVAPAFANAFSTTPPDAGPLVALDAQVNNLRLLQALPSFLTAGAAFIAWSQIVDGEVPKWSAAPVRR